MDIKIWLIIIGAVTSICGLMGFSHTSMRSRIDKLSNELMQRTTEAQVRALIHDQSKAQEVQNKFMSRRLDEIKEDQRKIKEDQEKMAAKMSVKMDKLYDLCVELKHDKN